MIKRIDPRQLTWICAPKLYILSSDKIVIETEPFTDLRPNGKSAEAVELSLVPKGSFCFSARVDFDFHRPFDQCGLILYEEGKRKMIIGTEGHDDETVRLRCIVYHGGRGDHSSREIGTAVSKMYYRIWYRGGAVRIQYSFTGSRYSDLREFWIDPESEKTISIGIYACSPANSWFDCTFSGMTLDEETERGDTDEN
jgi:regulation of enolase protein 1 (concanavalin A-like superfamily)